MEHWLLYFSAVCAVFLLPGPDMALVMNNAIQRGFRAGVWTAAGLAFSRSAHVVLSGVGLSALFHVFPVLLEVAKFAGAAFLIWLAYGSLRSNTDQNPDKPAFEGKVAFRQGLLTNLMNPKALMFCGVFLPQFIRPGETLAAEYLKLGSGLVVSGWLFDLIYAGLAARAASYLSGPSRTRTLINRMFAGIFALTAFKLILS